MAFAHFLVETKKEIDEVDKYLEINKAASKAIQSIQEYVKHMQQDIASDDSIMKARVWSQYAEALDKSINFFINLATKIIGNFNNASSTEKAPAFQKIIEHIQSISRELARAYQRDKRLDKVQSITLLDSSSYADPLAENLAIETYMTHLNDVNKILNISAESKTDKLNYQNKPIPEITPPCDTELKIATDTAIVSLSTQPFVVCSRALQAFNQSANHAMDFLTTANLQDKKYLSNSLSSRIQALYKAIVSASEREENLNLNSKIAIQNTVANLTRIKEKLNTIAKPDASHTALLKTFTSSYGTFFEIDVEKGPYVEREKLTRHFRR